jgi:adenosylmethionine-8-amino-7-oxononanoate aminotransferase
VYLYDTDGNQYIDGVSSLWCNVHGHGHRHINNAIKQQLDKIAHSTLLGLTNEPAIELARRLINITPISLAKVFYSDSGATAVEIAIKMAFQYWRNLGRADRTNFIALKQSYHGDTIGSMSVGGISAFHRIFGPLTFPVHFTDAPYPYRFDGSEQQCKDHCLAEMEKVLQQQGEKIAALVVEPLVQGAAGIIVHPDGFLKGVEKLARRYDTLLIVDEVATGFGRTGTMFACQQEQVDPDLMCLAKGITGGYLPLAATLASEKIFNAFLAEPWVDTTFYHGHTYTGNALGCAAALASLDIFEREHTLQNLPEKISLISKHLNDIAIMDYVGDVRQRGMIAGIELVADKTSKHQFDPALRLGAKLCRTMRNKGILMRPLGNVIVIMPPLAITIEILEQLLTVIADSIKYDLPELVAAL